MSPVRRLLLSLLLLAPGAGQAMAPDAELAALSAATLKLHRAAQAQVPLTDAGTISLYVAHAAAGLLLREVQVREDRAGAPLLAHYRYNDRESEALRRSGGLHRLAELSLPGGTHRLRIDISARGVDDGPTESMRRAQETIDLTVSAQPLAYQLQFEPGRFGFSPSIGARRVAADGAALERRQADFLQAAGRDLEAAALFGAPSASDAPVAAELQRYNAAVERLEHGDPRALAMLEALGTADADDIYVLRLRDQANVALGDALLRQQRAAEAAVAFERVRAKGAQASRALLGLGWARLGTASPAEAQHALAPWLELVGRDPLDPAVQEGLLAIAHALRQLGAQRQSEDFSHRAIRELDGARASVQQAREFLAGGAWAQALAAPDPGGTGALPGVPAALQASLGNAEASAALARYRRLSELQGLARGAGAELQVQLLAAVNAQGQRLLAAARHDLDQRQQQIERYLALAHLALARNYDRAEATP